jgi:hypothetical protein
MAYKECLLDEFWCMRLSLFRSGKAPKRFMEAPPLILSEICLKSRICFNSYCGISRSSIFVLFPISCAPSFLRPRRVLQSLICQLQAVDWHVSWAPREFLARLPLETLVRHTSSCLLVTARISPSQIVGLVALGMLGC